MNQISPAQVLAHCAPEFLDSLNDLERLLLPHLRDVWLRPEQIVPRSDFRSYGCLCGRGWGKTHGIASYINDSIELGRIGGVTGEIALMAPTEPRVDAVQIKALIDTSAPWFRPERYAGGLVWPNGVRALAFTPEAPGRTRSGNFECCWLTEIVDWQESTRWEAYTNITTATRRGLAQVLYDTTALGRNDVIEHLLEKHETSPADHLLVRGSLFDNPLLSRRYVEDECSKYSGRRAQEELWGRSFRGSAGALWTQGQIDSFRVSSAPPLVRVLVTCDPAQSETATSDETGITCGGATAAGHYYVTDDESGRYGPAEWGRRVVALAIRRGAIGVFVERNKLGDGATFPIEVAAREAGLAVRLLARDEAFPEARTEGVLYVKSAQTAVQKISRADGPAALTDAGRVHWVGKFSKLEVELTTYEPDTRKSPNRFDAFNYLIAELAGLGRETPPDNKAAVAGAAQVHASLREITRSLTASRRVGL